MLSIILIPNQNTSLKNGVQSIAIQAIQPFSFQLLFDYSPELHILQICGKTELSLLKKWKNRFKKNCKLKYNPIMIEFTK
jgi:hypothetical protein